MCHTDLQDDPEINAERRLVEAAVAVARADPRPAVPHDQVRSGILSEIELLNGKILGH